MRETDTPPDRDRARPLAGITVLDLSRVLAGPWCTQQLADFGADIVKIEHPVRGDETRGWGPPWLSDTQESAYFLSANRGKSSVAIDFATAEGAELVRDLAAQADVVVENFKVGGLVKYGLDYDSLAEINPALVYCSISGFGQTGPYAHRAGYDFLIQAMGGLMSLTGEPDGEPMKAGVAFADIFTGLYAANAILAALHQRTATGTGTHIDLALLDVQVAVLANQAAGYLATGHNPPRLGNAHPSIVPYQVFPSADQPLIVAAGNDGQFARLCDALERPGWAREARFATNTARVEHRDELIALLSERLRDSPREAWLACFERAGVPAGPIHTLAQVFTDPQVKARDMVIKREHGVGRSVPLVGNPTRFMGEPQNAERAPPQLGEQTHAELANRLGLTDAALETLTANGIIKPHID